jgi:hypothetical protein
MARKASSLLARATHITVALTLGGTVALQLTGTSGAADRVHPFHAVAESKRSLSFYMTHPCEFITKAEVASTLHQPMGAGQASPNSYGGSCSYQTTGTVATANVDFGFDPGTAASVHADIKGKTMSEPSVGHGAYCVTNGSAIVTFVANVGQANGEGYNLNLAVDTCAHGAALAKLGFNRLS